MRMRLLSLLLVAVPAVLVAQPGTPPPGRPYLFVLDLQGTALDEFPSAVKALNGVMTTVDKNGQRLLMASSPSEFLITLPQVLPAAFTVIIDLVPKRCCAPDDIMLEGTPTRNRGVASVELTWHPERISAVGGGGDMYQSNMPDDLAASTPANPTQLVFEFNGTTIKLYTNGRRMYTLDKQFTRGRVLRVWLGGEDATNPMYLAGLSVLDGAVAQGVIATNTPGMPPGGQPGGTGGTSGTGGTGGTGGTAGSGSSSTGSLPTSVGGVSVTQGPQGPQVSWAPVSVPATYSVQRWKRTSPGCCNNASPNGLGGPPWQDTPLPSAGTYIYEVTASFTGGTAKGQAQFTNFAAVGGSISTPATNQQAAGGTGSRVTSGGGAIGRPPSTSTLTVMNDATAPVLTLTPIPAGITLSFNSVAGANQYPVCRESPPGSNCVLISFPGITVGGNTLSEVDLGLAPGSSHAYRVTALRPDHHYGESAPVTGTAGALPAPTNLRVVQVDPSVPSLVLAWDPIQYTAWNGVKTLTTYQVTGSGVSGTQVVNGNQVTLPLSSGPGSYTWQVASIVPNPAGGWQASPPRAFAYDYAARYRLVALGVKALQQSADNIFAVDGIADEVYVAAVVNTTTRNLVGSSVAVARSSTYGDIGTGNPFPGRVQGGTASPRGGVRTGDVVPIGLSPAAATGTPNTFGFPFLLWEGSLDDNAMVIVAPSLWEEDTDKRFYGGWPGAVQYDIQRGYPYGLAAIITGLRDQESLGPGALPVGSGAGEGLLWCGCPDGVDRPLGLKNDSPKLVSDYFQHQVLVLTRRAIERFLAGPSQLPGGLAGTFVIPLYERTPDMTAMYDLYLRVERAP